MKRIYIDDSKRRKFPRLSAHGRRHIDYEITSIEVGLCDTECLYRCLQRQLGARTYWLYADSLISAAAVHDNVPVMETLLDFESGTDFALDALRGLRLKTVEVELGRRVIHGPEGGSWAPLKSGYSTTLPIHQTIGIGTKQNLSMQSLLLERYGLEQLHVCLRPGEWRPRQLKEVYGGLTPFQRALQLGHVQSAAFMLKEDPSCQHGRTSKGACLNDLLHRPDGGPALIQRAGAVFMEAVFAAQEARRVVDELAASRPARSKGLSAT